ncbi:hypothetical protein C0W65_14210 [Bacillus subtilis]|nr:hypothetical protein C0W65_14210 [Bacillus subtilis]
MLHNCVNITDWEEIEKRYEEKKGEILRIPRSYNTKKYREAAKKLIRTCLDPLEQKRPDLLLVQPSK